MSNRPSAPHTDRPTATYPTSDHLAHLEAHRQRLNDLWADATPTEELPIVDRPAPAPAPAPHVTTNAPQNEGPIQDMGRPRRLPAWHPSLMQLAIGAAVVLIALVGLQRYAVAGMADASHRCRALAVSDWQAATRECRGPGAGTPVPEQVPSSPHTPSPAPSQAPSPSTPPALTRVTSPSPSTQPSPATPSTPATQVASSWVTSDTGAPYDRTDPLVSPLDLPRCTTAPDTPLPCLAHASADGSHAVVLEEDGSMSGLVRR